MPGIEEIIDVFHLDDRAGADPTVLTAAARRFEHDCVLFRIGYEVAGGRQIDRVIIGIAALFEVVDVVGAVLIVRHGVADIRLNAVVLGGQEETLVVVSGFLRTRCAK